MDGELNGRSTYGTATHHALQCPYADHYQQLAAKYDGDYENHYNTLVRVIVDALKLTPEDKVLDVGAGTGAIASKIWKQVRLANPVTCVEPAVNMLEIAGQREGVVAKLASAEEFFSGSAHKNFNKILLCSVVHHFKKPTEVLKAMQQCFQNRSWCAIIKRPEWTTLPFFNEARRAFAESNFKTQPLLDMLSSLGFQVQTSTYVDKYSMQKSQWYKMIRDRYMSHLETFTDKEIEAGIEELEVSFKDQDVIEISDTILAICFKV